MTIIDQTHVHSENKQGTNARKSRLSNRQPYHTQCLWQFLRRHINSFNQNEENVEKESIRYLEQN